MNFITNEKIPLDIFHFTFDKPLLVTNENKHEIEFLHAIGCIQYDGKFVHIRPEAKVLYGKNGVFRTYETEQEAALPPFLELLKKVLEPKIKEFEQIYNGLSDTIVEKSQLEEAILNMYFFHKKMQSYK
jgi:hypothetical protein